MEAKYPEKKSQELTTYAHWIKPELYVEEGELDRVAKVFYPPAFLAEHAQALTGVLQERFNATTPQLLSNEIWWKLQNTDSHDVRVGHIEDVKEIIGTIRDWENIKTNFEKGSTMEMPIIAKFPDGVYHTVAGNTRIVVSKALGIRPMVVIVDFPEAI